MSLTEPKSIIYGSASVLLVKPTDMTTQPLVYHSLCLSKSHILIRSTFGDAEEMEEQIRNES